MIVNVIKYPRLMSYNTISSIQKESSMPQLSCQNLSIGYDGVAILSGLSFDINTGDYLCIVGENGSGKSTLMKAILGLKSSHAGSIEKGDDLESNEIGYIPQQTSV